MNATAHPAAERYLKELDRGLSDLPRDRRQEIVDEIRAHIDEAAPPGAGDAELRNVLEELGDPQTIATDARERFGIMKKHGGAVEGAAIVLLLIGGLLIPALGWLVGVVLLWISRVWSMREKVIGTLIVPGGLALPVYLFVFAPIGISVCTSQPNNSPGRRLEQVGTCYQEPLSSEWWGILLMVVIAALPIGTAIYLGRRAWRSHEG